MDTSDPSPCLPWELALVPGCSGLLEEHHPGSTQSSRTQHRKAHRKGSARPGTYSGVCDAAEMTETYLDRSLCSAWQDFDFDPDLGDVAPFLDIRSRSSIRSVRRPSQTETLSIVEFVLLS